MSLVLAALVILGFSRTVNASLFHANPPRPLLLWIHGAAFSMWIAFFIAQSALVRVRKVSVHRLLGWFGALLAALMVVLGVTIAVVMTRFDTVVLHQKGVEAFLIGSIRRHVHLRLVHRAGNLLEKKTGIPSAASVYRNLPAYGRCHRQIRLHVQPQPLLPRLGLSDPARHGCVIGWSISASTKSISMRCPP